MVQVRSQLLSCHMMQQKRNEEKRSVGSVRQSDVANCGGDD